MRIAFGLGILACGLAWAQPAPPATPAQPSRDVVVSGGQASYLGIGVQEVSAERAKALNLKEARGAEVTSVADGSPAAKAGIKEHDVVLEYNGQAVEGTEQLTRLVRETPADREVKISVWRNGKTVTLTATVGTRPAGMATMTPYGAGGGAPYGAGGALDSLSRAYGEFTRINPPQIDIPRFQMNWQNPRLGIVGESLGREEQLADFFGVKDGVLVRSVVKDSAAEKSGIKAGDVIVKVDSSPVSSAEEITRTLRDLSKTTIPVVVVRNKKETTLSVTIEKSVGAAPRMAWAVGV
ncbi:MAG: PDZ domain-containing protein [Bryobacteraceae bacterium]|jgi:serine protease Do